eukprot:SAG31_NODE_4718_length_3010_cov_2.593267_2_plen_714_part_00
MAGNLKSRVLQHEVAINELVAQASARGEELPTAAVIAKCASVLDELHAAKAFGPYQRLMSTIKSLLYRALFSDEVTTAPDGQLAKVAFAVKVQEQQKQLLQLQEDLKYQKSCFRDVDKDLESGREEMKRLSDELEHTRKELTESQDSCQHLEQQVVTLKAKLAEQVDEDSGNIRHMAREIEASKQAVVDAKAAADDMKRYVESQESRRKAFADMQHNRRLTVDDTDAKMDDLQQALVIENQVVLLLNLRIEEFERGILGASVKTTDRLRELFLQEMLVIHEELAAIRRHISQLGRENLIAGVKNPLASLTAGNGTVFQIEREVCASFDGGKSFHEMQPCADSDLFPVLEDQFIQQAIFDTTHCAALATRTQEDRPQKNLPAATHVRVKLRRRHQKAATTNGLATIPLSELPLSLGSGPLWQLFLRNNGQEMAPKRPKEVDMTQLLRLIDEIQRCKAIMEDDRESMQVPTTMEKFFFQHMQSTYGEERVVLHVVHGVFKAIEKFRAVVPTVELFYRTLIATVDDSGWRYMQQCRKFLSSKIAEGKGPDGVKQLRACIQRLYNGITEHELEILVENYRAFAIDYRDRCRSIQDDAAYGSSGATDGEASDGATWFESRIFFEFLTQSLLDDKEYRHNKIRKKLIAIDALQKNTLKINQFQQFISGYAPGARKTLPTMLYRGAAETVKHQNPSASEVKVNLSCLALVCAVVEMSLLC